MLTYFNVGYDISYYLNVQKTRMNIRNYIGTYFLDLRESVNMAAHK